MFVFFFSATCAYAITMDMGGRNLGVVFGLMNMAGNFGAYAFTAVVPRLNDRYGGDWTADAGPLRRHARRRPASSGCRSTPTASSANAARPRTRGVMLMSNMCAILAAHAGRWRPCSCAGAPTSRRRKARRRADRRLSEAGGGEAGRARPRRGDDAGGVGGATAAAAAGIFRHARPVAAAGEDAAQRRPSPARWSAATW